MSTYTEVASALEQCPQWRRIAFTVSGAERIAPLVYRVGGEAEAALYSSGLEAAWKSLADPTARVEAARLLREVDAVIEENDEDDGDTPEFFAMRALSVLSYALKTIQSDDTRPSKWLSSELLGIKSAFDFVLQEESQRPTHVDLNNPPPPGTLQALESEIQKGSLQLLADAERPDARLLSALQGMSKEAARDFDSQIPAFASRMGWKV